MSGDVTAPAEGSATTPGEIADELNEACDCLRTTDYNAFTPDQLADILAAFNTLEELCLHFRERQRAARDRQRGTADENGTADPDSSTDSDPDE